MNNRIKGIVIDAGHGGEDPGAVYNGIQEKDFNLEVARYMYDRFLELGAPVTLVRSTDETVTPDERTRRILAAYGDDPNVIVISNHINSGGGEGAEVIYALRNNSNLAKSVLEAIEQEGQIARKYYQRRLPENPIRDYYFIHRNTGSTQPILVEYGFIDNANDLVKLQNNLLDFAEGVVRAVSQYAGITYIPPAGSENLYYTVQSGDSLWSIARRFGTTVDALRELNNLTSNTLQIGQVLRIYSTTPTPPSNEQEYITYTVKAGDSLYRIAQNYNTTVNAIINLNNLTTDTLQIGQQLLIPVDQSSTPPTEGQYYTVQRGDSLYSIARRFNTTVDAIIQANNLSNINLQIGDQLLIPSTTTTPNPPSQITYTVQSGDSLWSIAKRYNITVNDLRNANNLTSNTLQIGQILIIPTTSSDNYITYTVKSGDSLYRIAQNYNTTVDAIRNLNNLSTNVLQIGQQLKIPT